MELSNFWLCAFVKSPEDKMRYSNFVTEDEKWNGVDKVKQN